MHYVDGAHREKYHTKQENRVDTRNRERAPAAASIEYEYARAYLMRCTRALLERRRVSLRVFVPRATARHNKTVGWTLCAVCTTHSTACVSTSTVSAELEGDITGQS